MNLFHRGSPGMGVGGALAALAAASLLTAAGALAATKTINVNDTDKGLPKCYDIEKVVADAGKSSSKFTVTMAANQKSRTCSGPGNSGPIAPSLVLNSRCSVSVGSGNKASMSCEGGGGGPAKITLNPQNSKEWLITFATKEAELKGTTSFNFEVTIAEGSDTAGPATVKIG
jgi:hypothetical protein